MSFEKQEQLCNYHSNEDFEYLHHPKKFLHAPWWSMPQPHPQTLLITGLISVPIVLCLAKVL